MYFYGVIFGTLNITLYFCNRKQNNNNLKRCGTPKQRHRIMKTMKVNHTEILNNLSNELATLKSAHESASKAWSESGQSLYDRDEHLLKTMVKIDNQIKKLEKTMEFHRIMLQDKKYATMWLWSDAHAYEIIEEKSGTMLTVRRLKATLKKDAEKALRDSFEVGGFCGHFENSCQEWDFETDESNPIETIRKHKDGRWYGCGGMRFTIKAEPYERYDFNF